MIGRRRFGELASRQHAYSVLAPLRPCAQIASVGAKMAAGDTIVWFHPIRKWSRISFPRGQIFARVGLIDRRIQEVTSRLDVLCTLVAF